MLGVLFMLPVRLVHNTFQALWEADWCFSFKVACCCCELSFRKLGAVPALGVGVPL
jgi:hypothetical protein